MSNDKIYPTTNHSELSTHILIFFAVNKKISATLAET